jgi:hypothetical protein
MKIKKNQSKYKKIQKKTYIHRKFIKNSKNKKNIHIEKPTASIWVVLRHSIEFTKTDTKHSISHISTGIHRISHQNTYKYTQYTQEYTQLTHMDTETPHIDTPPNTHMYTPPRIVHPETDTLINSSFGTRYGTSISGVEIHTPQFGTRKYVQIHTIHTGIHTKRHNMTQNDTDWHRIHTYSHRIPHKLPHLWVGHKKSHVYIYIYIYIQQIHTFHTFKQNKTHSHPPHYTTLLPHQ